MWRSFLELLPFLGSLLLAIVFGYLVGRIVDVQLSLPDTPIVLRESTRPQVPVVRIKGVRDGTIQGTITGEARLFLGEEYVIQDASGAFAHPADLFFMHVVSILIPEGMQFVASKRGTYYYPVSSKEAERLVPENRLYFRTEQEAKNAGYKPKGK
jgi:hypothetical protein